MSLSTPKGWTIAEIRIVNVILQEILGAYELSIGLEFNVLGNAIDRDEPDITAIRLISGDIQISGPAGGQYRLGKARPHEYDILRVHSHPDKPQRRFTLPLTNSQVAAIETTRAASNLKFSFHLWAELISENPRDQANDDCTKMVARSDWIEQLTQANDDCTITVARSDWIEQLKHAGFLDTLLIEVPFPAVEMPDTLRATKDFLREAQRHFLNGEFTSTVASCRKVIEEVGNHQHGTTEWPNGAFQPFKSGNMKDMEKDDRERALLAMLNHYSHLAHHSESQSGHSEYSRSEAGMILEMTAVCARRAAMLS